MQTSSRALLGLLPFSLVLALGACTGHVVGTGSSGATDSSTDGTGGCFGGCEDDDEPPPVLPVNAIAFRAYQVGWSDPGSGGSSSSASSSSSSGGVDPNTLYLALGNQGVTCADPTSLPCGGYFGVTIGVPPALVQVGSLPLSTPGLISDYFESGSGDPNDCPGGSGSFLDGTLTISAVETATVSFSLSGTQAFDLAVGSADGSYVATVCGGP
jgi:hypothetical protein